MAAQRRLNSDPSQGSQGERSKRRTRRKEGGQTTWRDQDDLTRGQGERADMETHIATANQAKIR